VLEPLPESFDARKEKGNAVREIKKICVISECNESALLVKSYCFNSFVYFSISVKI
jgi:hypothetical protein